MVKSFLKKCPVSAKLCIFCHHPRTKLVLQNSRFIRAGVAAKLEKEAAQDKDRGPQEDIQIRLDQPKEGETLEEMVDAQSYITSEQVSL